VQAWRCDWDPNNVEVWLGSKQCVHVSKCKKDKIKKNH
jgi:hypothetical protein